MLCPDLDSAFMTVHYIIPAVCRLVVSSQTVILRRIDIQILLENSIQSFCIGDCSAGYIYIHPWIEFQARRAQPSRRCYCCLKPLPVAPILLLPAMRAGNTIKTPYYAEVKLQRRPTSLTCIHLLFPRIIRQLLKPMRRKIMKL